MEVHCFDYTNVTAGLILLPGAKYRTSDDAPSLRVTRPPMKDCYEIIVIGGSNSSVPALNSYDFSRVFALWIPWSGEIFGRKEQHNLVIKIWRGIHRECTSRIRE
jgi:hypothetical protein